MLVGVGHAVACMEQRGFVVVHRVWESHRSHRIQGGMHACTPGSRHPVLVQLLTVRHVCAGVRGSGPCEVIAEGVWGLCAVTGGVLGGTGVWIVERRKTGAVCRVILAVKHS